MITEFEPQDTADDEPKFKLCIPVPKAIVALVLEGKFTLPVDEVKPVVAPLRRLPPLNITEEEELIAFTMPN